MTDKKSSKVLDGVAVKQKTLRMAYQIVENNYNESEIVLVGLRNQGYNLAERLQAEIENISSIKVRLESVELDKREPLSSDIKMSCDANDLAGKVILMVDDVANTGRTLFYAMQPLLSILPKKVQVAVLVDRKHKSFPICSDYVGLSLSTTMQEHIEVSLSESEDEVVLS